MALAILVLERVILGLSGNVQTTIHKKLTVGISIFLSNYKTFRTHIFVMNLSSYIFDIILIIALILAISTAVTFTAEKIKKISFRMEKKS